MVSPREPTGLMVPGSVMAVRCKNQHDAIMPTTNKADCKGMSMTVSGKITSNITAHPINIQFQFSVYMKEVSIKGTVGITIRLMR